LRRAITYSILIVGLAFGVWLVMRTPTIQVGTSRAKVLSTLGAPRLRLAVDRSKKLPRACGQTSAVYALMFPHRFGVVLLVYFDSRDKVVCTDKAFSFTST